MPTPLTTPPPKRNQNGRDNGSSANTSSSSTSPRKESDWLNDSDALDWEIPAPIKSESGRFALVDKKLPEDYTVQFRRPKSDDQRSTLPDSTRKPSKAKAMDVSIDHDIALRSELDAAMRNWVVKNKLPSKELLREGLLALNEGMELPLDEKALLLRTSLAYHAGIRTAIRRQDDAELAAIIICEAITDPTLDEPPAYLLQLFAKAPDNTDLKKALISELRSTTSGTDPRARMHAVSALWYLDQQSEQPELSSTNEYLPSSTKQVIGVIVAMAVTLVAVWYAYVLSSQPVVGVLPAGTYTLQLADGQEKVVTVSQRKYDVFEVTNRDYRLCMQRGHCTRPALTALEGIEDYFIDPKYDNYPVVYVSHAQAAAYCASRGKRLPSEDEWMLAVAAAPSTGVSIIYPWGNEAIPQRANTADAGIGYPVEVGSYRPSGDSTIGVADLIGNVAEWTSTLDSDGHEAVVKGGSFRDDMRSSDVSDRTLIPLDVVADWIGFRCVDVTN